MTPSPAGESGLPRSLGLRLGCVAATAAVCLLWHNAPLSWVWATYSFGFAHYLLALRYSGGPLRQVLDAPTQVLSLIGLLLLGIAFYQTDLPLILYFGAHHALNEAYARRSLVSAPRVAAGMAGPPARFDARGAAYAAAFHALAYLTVLRWSPELAPVDPHWIWIGLSVTGFLVARVVWQLRRRVAGRQLLDLCAPELTSAALVVLSLFIHVTFLQVVFFHFLLWAVLPIDRIRQRGTAALGEYAALSGATIGVFLVLSPLGPAPLRIGAGRFTELFLLLSYLHITLSFALSDAHPGWAIRFFRGATERTPSVSAYRHGAGGHA